MVNTLLVADAKNLLVRMRQTAGDFKYEMGHDIPINVLADKTSELAQEYSQHIYMRPLCVVSLLFTIDDENRPQLYKLDPAGFYIGYKATSAGEKEQAATANLEKAFKKNPSLSVDDTIKTAIKVLQDVNY